MREKWFQECALPVFLVVLALGMASPAGAQDAMSFPNLDPAQRIYDETGDSLTTDEIASLNEQIADLRALGADPVLMVRDLDATPDETLDQVEALQQAWVAATGGNQDVAIAILINRDPDDDHSARAGIFVGSTYNDGNVPESEQVAIVNEELIPPLRDGDVYQSFSNALTRLESSIVNGPPQGAFESWASDAGGSWFAWVSAALAAVAGVGSVSLFRKRSQLNLPDLPSTTVRPGDLTPALAGALVAGAPQASATPATLVDLASRGALAIEPESEGGMFSTPKVQVRLRDQGVVADDVESALWRQLEARGSIGIVSSKDLARIAADTSPLKDVLDRQLLERGWKDPAAGKPRGILGMIGIAAIAGAVFCAIVAGSGGTWLPVIGAIAFGAAAIAAFWMSAKFSPLSLDGQDAARQWKAYRAGLKAGAADRMVYLDFDQVLPDVIAMNLGSAMDKRLKEATEAGVGLRAFSSTMQGSETHTMGAYFPFWVAFNSSVATSSGSSSSSTVSGSGAGGGGGAAGST